MTTSALRIPPEIFQKCRLFFVTHAKEQQSEGPNSDTVDMCNRPTVPVKGAFAMDPLQQELDRLLGELAELDRCSARRGSDAANLSLITIARRGTNLAIAEVRSLMARRSSLH